MGASGYSASTATPPEPATVKRVESEVTAARNKAKNAATKKYGIGGTNITRGAIAPESAETKKNKLGGDV